MRGCFLWVLPLSGCFFVSNGDDVGGGGGVRPDANLIDACVPRVCSIEGASCGAIDDGCGGMLDCGTCSGLATCGGQGVANVCAIPATQRACDDGWCWEAPAPFSFMPTSVFAVSATDVWAVGARGAVMHYDGTHWRAVSAGTTADLDDVWMASATDGWLVGAAGVIRRWNGTAWNPVTSGTLMNLTGVWGSAANNVYIVGDKVAKRWNGSSLLDAAATVPSLADVFIAGSTVFSVGEGRVWELVAATWTERTNGPPTFTSYSLTDIGGTATDVYALGRSYSFGSGEDLAYRWTGSGSWTGFSDPGDPEWTAVFTDGTQVKGASDESIAMLPSLQRVQGPGGIMQAVAAAGGQTFIAEYPGSEREQLHSGSFSSWTPAASFGRRRDLEHLAVAGDSVWFASTYDVTEWNGGLIEHDLPTSYRITAIGGTARDDVWLATEWDTFHFDGTAWSEVTDAPLFPGTSSIVIVNGQPALIGGDDLFVRTSTGWQEHVPDANVSFDAGDEHAGELYIAGTTEATPYEGRVMRSNAGTWTALPNPPMQHACGIVALGPDDIWVSGYNNGSSVFVAGDGIVAHWNGQSWAATTHADGGALCALELHGGELWVSGEDTLLYRRSAAGAWSTNAPTRAGSIRALRAQGTTLWAVGDYGAVLRRQ
jgi:hypothetical protein